MASSQPQDTITQLQTCLDQLATQFYASLRYISEHHPMSDFASNPHDLSSTNPQNYLSVAASLGLPQPSPFPPSSTQTQTQPTQPSTQPSSTQLSTQPTSAPPSQQPPPPPVAAAAESKDPAQASKNPPLSPSWSPHEPESLALDMRELSADLVAKQKQIEALLQTLPRDLVAAERAQEGRIRELQEELVGLERGVRGAKERREKMLERVDGVIAWVGEGRGV